MKMKRSLAFIWIAVVLLAAGYLGFRLQDGLNFRSDLLALLPREDHDPELQLTHEMMTEALSRRVLLMVGDADKAMARREADRIEQALLAGGAFLPGTAAGSEALRAIGELYAAHRGHLLAAEDRQALLRGEPDRVAARAMAQVFSPVMPLNAAWLRQDPFLLLPAFIADLPRPSGRALPDAGRLAVVDNGITWFLVDLRLNGSPTDLDVQSRAVNSVAAALAAAQRQQPSLHTLRLGTVFFAEAGARSGLREASWLGSLSLIGTAVLLLVVFRNARPLLQNMLTAAVGVLVGLAASLWLFGDLHIGTLLFGTSLIGVVVDYSLHYSATAFDPAGGTPAERLRRIGPALWLGLGTTLIGYIALAIAPLPGLRQIAVFSGIGLIAAFLCVVLWLPLLDRQQAQPAEGWAFRLATQHWPRLAGLANSRRRFPALIILALLAGYGLLTLHPNDDVRRLQSLAPDLLQQQQQAQALLGGVTETQFLLIRAGDDEAALQRQESLRPLLDKLLGDGSLLGYLMPAGFVPSLARQAENAELIEKVLESAHGESQRTQLGLGAELPAATAPLTWNTARQSGALPFLEAMALWPGGHVVLLQGLRDPAALRQAISGNNGVTLIDPAADVSQLLGRYRERVQWLLGLSCLLLLPVLAWRYGWQGAIWMALPPALAMALTPALLALLGFAFTVFHAMALVLILSIGIDYAIFFAESEPAERPVALLGTVLATLTTQLAFGLLAFSSAPAVAGFGLTMLIGITAACLLAPLAGKARPGRRRP